MPFKSEKQRKWMWANNPEMAKKWEKEEKKMKRETKVRSLIRKMVREMMKEGFAGSLKKEDRKKFDKMRRKQSEVLGYKLAGTNDVKTEIDDATVHEKPKPIKEAKERNYKEEYKKYGSSKKAKKYRAELNKYNRQKGTYGNGDKKDASHKGGKIVGFEAESKNRGRAEKSRLKKEAHEIKFSKDEMELLHKNGKLEKDGHTYLYSEDLFNESGILYRAGVKKYGKEGMKKIQQAAGKRKSHAEIGKIKDKYEKGKKNEGKLTEDKFIAFYKKDKVTVTAKSLWDAKKQIIAKLKVPKKDVGLVSVLNKTEYDKQKLMMLPNIQMVSMKLKKEITKLNTRNMVHLQRQRNTELN